MRKMTMQKVSLTIRFIVSVLVIFTPFSFGEGLVAFLQ
jgi:hypothetical protein